MKRQIILALMMMGCCTLAQSQMVTLNAGALGNFTPRSTMGISAGASYEIPKTNDLVGYMVMTNNFRTYNIPYYGTKLGRQTRLLGGVNFVNDYSGCKRVLSQSFMVGFNYDFKKPTPQDLFNMYGGFIYTHQYFLFRAGFNISPWRKKRDRACRL